MFACFGRCGSSSSSVVAAHDNKDPQHCGDIKRGEPRPLLRSQPYSTTQIGVASATSASASMLRHRQTSSLGSEEHKKLQPRQEETITNDNEAAAPSASSSSFSPSSHHPSESLSLSPPSTPLLPMIVSITRRLCPPYVSLRAYPPETTTMAAIAWDYLHDVPSNADASLTVLRSDAQQQRATCHVLGFDWPLTSLLSQVLSLYPPQLHSHSQALAQPPSRSTRRFPPLALAPLDLYADFDAHSPSSPSMSKQEAECNVHVHVNRLELYASSPIVPVHKYLSIGVALRLHQAQLAWPLWQRGECDPWNGRLLGETLSARERRKLERKQASQDLRLHDNSLENCLVIYLPSSVRKQHPFQLEEEEEVQKKNECERDQHHQREFSVVRQLDDQDDRVLVVNRHYYLLVLDEAQIEPLSQQPIRAEWHDALSQLASPDMQRRCLPILDLRPSSHCLVRLDYCEALRGV